jgi:hypothetical protein
MARHNKPSQWRSRQFLTHFVPFVSVSLSQRVGWLLSLLGTPMDRGGRVGLFASPCGSMRGLFAYPRGPFRTAQDHLCRLAGDSLSSEENREKASSMICEYVRPRVGKGNWAQAIYKAGPQRDNLCTSSVGGIESKIQWCPAKNVVPRTYPFWHFSDLNLRWACDLANGPYTLPCARKSMKQLSFHDFFRVATYFHYNLNVIRLN